MGLTYPISRAAFRIFLRISSPTPGFPASALETVTALTPTCFPISRMVMLPVEIATLLTVLVYSKANS